MRKPGAARAVWRPTPAVRLSVALHAAAAGALALHPAWWPGVLAGLTGNHLLLGAVGMWPRSQAIGPTLHRLPGAHAAVALTFDDGPDPAVTPQVLDLLAAAGATATFFCIGERARAHAGLVRRIVAAGHGVENHSLTHPLHFACLVGRPLRREVEDAQATLADITGRAPRWFRAPMGLRNPLLQPVLAHAGLEAVSWTRRGYDTRCRDPATVLARLLRGLHAGDVLMLHDGNAARAADGAAVALHVLPALLAAMAQGGLSAARLPDAMPAPAA